MKILVIPPNDLFRHPIPNRLYHVLSRLDKNNFRLFLLSYPGHPLGSKTRMRKFNCYEITYKTFLRINNLGLYYIENFLPIKETLNKYLSNEDIDVILNANILPSYIATKIAKKHNIKVVFDYLDYFPESASYYYEKNIMKKTVYNLVNKITKYNIINSDELITVSHTFKLMIKNIINNQKKKINVIPNGVDSNLFKPIPKHIARNKVNLDRYDNILLYYGSLDKWIDIFELFLILKELRKTSKNFVLILIGVSHSNLIRELNKFIKRYELDRNIIIISPVSYELIPIYINSADVVIAPYAKSIKNYTTPLKIIETLATGTPVITRNIMEFKFWFTNKLVKYYDEHTELLRHITDFEKIDELSYKEKIAISKKIRKKFSWERIVHEYEKVLVR